MVYQLISTLTKFSNKLLSVALMFTLSIDKYDKGVIGNTAIATGVIEKRSMKSPPS